MGTFRLCCGGFESVKVRIKGKLHTVLWAAGHDIRDEDIARLSPLKHENLKVTWH